MTFARVFRILSHCALGSICCEFVDLQLLQTNGDNFVRVSVHQCVCTVFGTEPWAFTAPISSQTPEQFPFDHELVLQCQPRLVDNGTRDPPFQLCVKKLSEKKT